MVLKLQLNPLNCFHDIKTPHRQNKYFLLKVEKCYVNLFKVDTVVPLKLCVCVDKEMPRNLGDINGSKFNTSVFHFQITWKSKKY